MKSPILSCAIILTLALGALRAAYADSATWNLSPMDGNWNNAANWTPATVPNGPSDTATFAASNLTAISFSANSVEVAAVVFDVGASAFNIVADPAVTFNITGTGIINNSGVTQNFTVAPSANTHVGTIDFQNAATVDDGTVLTVYGAETFGVDGGLITFHDTATAANATLISYGALTGHEVGGGVFAFFGSSTAGNAHFEINGALASGGFGGGATFNDEASAGNAVFVLNAPAAPNRDAGGVTFRGNATAANGAFTLNGATNTNFNFGEPPNITFEDGATADHGLFTVNGGQEPDTFGCSVTFGFTSGGLIISAGHATLINNGGQAANADGGGTTFLGSTTAEQAHLIANGGANGGEGGHIYFFSDADGGEAQLELFGNGVLNVSFHNLPSVTIGSLAGDGFVYTGARNLTVGSNNLDTTFSGIIQEQGGIVNDSPGSLAKIGTGTLTLTGANTYTGGTVVNEGTLKVANTSGSGTGAGAVEVNAGNLAGKGIIAGAVTIGTGSGTGAFLAPGAGARKTNTLTIQSALTIKADGTYSYRLKTKKAEADQVIANGVTIDSGAQFSFKQLANKRLTAGTVFTAIDNTSANPISGTFANLPDDSTFVVGNNTYQADYQGGDANDLTLTVVP